LSHKIDGELFDKVLGIDITKEIFDFPLGNLGNPDLSSYKFLAEELFPDHLPEKVVSVSKERCSKNPIRENPKVDMSDNNRSYSDFSQFTDEEALMQIGHTSNQKSTIETFPIKLHKIMERADVDGYSHIISWLPHGRAIRIHDSKAFVAKIMPRYFYISKYTSFIRQLSIYGFRKVSRKGIDKGAYYHDLFLSGRPGLCAGISRLKSRPTLKSKFEPNFYQMPPIFQLPTIEDIKRGYISNEITKPRVIQYHVEEEPTKKKSTDEKCEFDAHSAEKYEGVDTYNLGLHENSDCNVNNYESSEHDTEESLLNMCVADKIDSEALEKLIHGNSFDLFSKDISLTKDMEANFLHRATKSFKPVKKFCYSSAA